MKMTLNISSLNKSPKIEGRYEVFLKEAIIKYFVNKNFEVRTHVYFNIAWGSVLSEIDILALRDDKITIIEIKSKRDKLIHVKKQYNNIKAFIDYYYIASDNDINIFKFNDEIGIIKIDDDDIAVIKKAKQINHDITINDLIKLKKSDLLNIIGSSKYKRLNKRKLSYIILEQKKDTIKKEMQKILLNT